MSRLLFLTPDERNGSFSFGQVAIDGREKVTFLLAGCLDTCDIMDCAERKSPVETVAK